MNKTRMSLLNRSFVHLALIALLGLLVYSNTFNAPFQWDEKDFIVKNPVVKDLDYFMDLSKVKGLGTLKSRYIGYLTFALNYRIHGLDVTGYHIANLAIHILNALLVYSLVVLTFRTPFLVGSSLEERSKHIALLTGLLFVSHPVQTEAVTYIFQRLASLMAFFYLLSLVAYIASRLSTRNTLGYLLYIASFVSAVLAMKTKENAFTLPLVITLYEFFFFRGSKMFRILRLFPILLTLFIIPFALIGANKSLGEIMGGMSPATGEDADALRWNYLLTQFRVVVTYIRLLFLPINQNIDYDYPIFHSLLNPQVFLSFLSLLSIFGFGIYLLYCSRFRPILRLLAFGIFFFFITLSVESSLIPISMVINEYRVYLPSVGAFIAVITGIFLLVKKFDDRKIQIAIVLFLALVPLIFSGLTFARNTVWKTEVRLWEDTARKSPHKARVHSNLGVAYRAKGLIDKAIEHYRVALILTPDSATIHNNLGNAYRSKGLSDKAIEHYRAALRLRLDFAEAHFNLGIAYLEKGFIEEACREFNAVLEINPYHNKACQLLNQISELK